MSLAGGSPRLHRMVGWEVARHRRPPSSACAYGFEEFSPVSPRCQAVPLPLGSRLSRAVNYRCATYAGPIQERVLPDSFPRASLPAGRSPTKNSLMVTGADLRLMGYDFGPPKDKPRPTYVLRISLRIHHH